MKKVIFLAALVVVSAFRLTSPAEYRMMEWDKYNRYTSYCEMIRQNYMEDVSPGERAAARQRMQNDEYFKKAHCWSNQIVPNIFGLGYVTEMF